MAGDLADVEYVVRTMARTAVDNEKYFGDLDAVVGDGDFGYSLARGFGKLVEDETEKWGKVVKFSGAKPD